jgi:predicted transcriptional regulator
MIDELNIKANKFADTVQIGRSTLYAWWSGKLILSEATAQRIDEYLTRYGF